MKLQHLSASAFVLLGLVSLGCSSPDDEIFMGSDGSGGSSAGTKDPGGAGTGQGASESGGTGSGGSSSGAGTGMGGSSSAGSSNSGGTAMAGTGSGGTGSGGTGTGGYDPCAGKACGDFCTACDPEDANCIAPAVEMTCTATGNCSVGRPACTVPECEEPQKYFAPGCDAGAKPVPYQQPFIAGCYDLCSSAGTCPDGYTCTDVWYDPSASCPPGEACIAACGGAAKICIEN